MAPAAASPSPFHVLVVDDEKNIRATLALCLESLGCEVTQAPSAAVALEAAALRHHDLAFVDLRLGTQSGLDLIPALLAENPNLDVVVVTAYATIDTAVEAVRRGAKDYLAKPFTPAQIAHLVARSRESATTARQLRELQSRLAEATPEVELGTRSPAMQRTLELLARAAASDAPVLFRGESGTGKGVLARALHAASPRAQGPFVTVNCPTLSEDLLTSELFGHARGAFTGAVRDQPGRVEAAHQGTLFLDEIAELTPALQAKLLRFVQDKQFERLGETRTRHTDVRVVTATHRPLEDMVRDGRFREDLLYRLNVVEVALPPLRERPEDLLPMARGFVRFFAQAARRRPPELSPAVERMLLAYPWPGNVRELRNAVERALIVWPADVLEPQAFPERIAQATGAAPMQLGGPHTLEEVEREHILRVLAQSPSLDDAARTLGIDASTLWRKRKKYEA